MMGTDTQIAPQIEPTAQPMSPSNKRACCLAHSPPQTTSAMPSENKNKAGAAHTCARNMIALVYQQYTGTVEIAGDAVEATFPELEFVFDVVTALAHFFSRERAAARYGRWTEGTYSGTRAQRDACCVLICRNVLQQVIKAQHLDAWDDCGRPFSFNGSTAGCDGYDAWTYKIACAALGNSPGDACFHVV